MKKGIILFAVIAVLSYGLNLFAQDAPTSVGPAPVVDVQSNNNQNPVSLLNVNSRGFVHISGTSSHQMNKQFMGNVTVTPIGSPFTTAGWIGATARHTNGTIYVCNQAAPFQIWTLDTTSGAATLVTSCTGLPQTNFTGMTWDHTTNTMYGLSSSLTVSQIFTINLTTGVCTPIGSASAVCLGGISLVTAPNGTLFTHDIVGNNLYKWNKTTGVATLVGALGFDANFGQDAAFDLSDGMLYLASAGPGNILRVCDTTTGSATTVIGTYAGQPSCLSIVPFATAPTTCSKIAGNWCPANTYPSLPLATYFHAAAWLGDTMYVQAPTSAGVGATTIYRYKFGGTWSTGTPCLTGVAGASMNAVNGKLYLIGGGTAGVTTGTNNVQEYNPANGTWTAKAPMPAALSAHGSVVWGDSVIFVVGGPYTGAATNLNVHYYRPASDTWGTLTNSLPAGQGRRTFALSIVGNKIIMTCGFNTAYLKTTYVGTIGANATSLTWAPGQDAPVALSRPAGTSYGNFSFLVGGDTNGTAVKNNKIFVYNATSNTWFNQILNAPNPSSNMMSAVTMKCINDTARIFQPGGYGTAAFANFDVVGCGAILTGNSNNYTETPADFIQFITELSKSI